MRGRGKIGHCKNGSKHIIPTVFFPGGVFLVEPTSVEMSGKPGLKTKAIHNHYELIIVGSDPASLIAALYTVREVIDTAGIREGA